MLTIGKAVRLLAIFTLLSWVFAKMPVLYAQTILSGAQLENACQAYAEKAVKYANEWEQLQCQKKLGVAPQIFDTDSTYHLKRCRNSVGTSITADLQGMEKELIPCRGTSGATTGGTSGGTSGGGGTTPPTPTRPPTVPPRRDYPPPATRNPEGDLWDIVVINSTDLARSDHTFRIPTLNGMFTAQNARSGGPEFSGQANGSTFEGVMTDRTGYRATLIGRRVSPDRIEGTGCDNRGRSYSWTMIRR